MTANRPQLPAGVLAWGRSGSWPRERRAFRGEPTQAVELVHSSRRTRVERAWLGGERVFVKSSAVENPRAADVDVLVAERRYYERLAGPGVAELVPVADLASEVLVFRDLGHRPITPLGLTFADRLDVAQRITRVVQRIHEAGVVHGDLNPSNILRRSSDGDVQLIDFGISFEPMDAAAAAARGLVGTVEYIAPEQTGRTARGIDTRADLYSLGVTFFELFTGALPFQESDASGFVHAHLSKEPAPMIAVPAIVERMVRRLLAKDPDERYQTAAGLLRDLEACRAGLREDGSIEPFEIGISDRSAVLHVPPLLVERERALAMLSDGDAGVVVVAGRAGLGKTALLAAARKQLRARRLVASIALSEADAGVPLSAVVAILSSLAGELAVESAEEVARWRRELGHAIAPEGAVLLEMQPRLASIVGPQPRLAELGPREAQARRASVLMAFLGALASRRGLTLLIDDARYVDRQSATLLARMASDERARMRVVVAVDAWSSELLVARAMGEVHVSVGHLALEALSPSGVEAIVRAALGGAAEPVEALAKVVYAKTAGNPALVRDLLERAYAQRVLTLEGTLTWDEAAIWRMPSSADVIDQTVHRLQGFSSDARSALELAACLGEEVDLALLREIAPQEIDIELALAAAREGRVLVPGAVGWVAFAHARVRDALLAGMVPEVRSAAHLAVARSLASRLPDHHDAGWFAVADHCHLGRAALSTASERSRAVEVECRVAAMARAAGAYDVAITHLVRALEAPNESEWAARAGERFALLRDHAECVGLSGDHARAASLAAELARAASTGLERARARRIEALALTQQAKLLEGIEAFREGLREVGVELPDRPEVIGAAIGEGLSKMQARLALTPPRAIAKLPEVTDPVVVEAMGLLFQLIPAAFQAAPPLFVLAELTMLDLALTHGVTPTSSKNLLDCGIIAIKVFGDSAQALELADAAFTLIERFSPTPLAAAVQAVYGAYIAPWRETPSGLLKVLADAERAGALGDVEHASYASAWYASAKRLFGHPLAECSDSADAAMRRSRAAGALVPAAFAEGERRAIAGVRGTEPGMTSDELAGIQAYGAHAVLSRVQSEFVRACVLCDLDAACSAFALLAPMAETARGTHGEGELLAFGALHRARLLAVEGGAREDEDSLRTGVASAEDTLRRWAAVNPAFFGPFHGLAVAERRRVERAPAAEVAEAYDAVADVKGAPWLHLRAIACERQAELWISLGRSRLAGPLLREAYSLYERWGADAKLEQLAAAHPGAFSSTDADEPKAGNASATWTRSSLESIDVASIVKAVTAISSEVRVERLYEALMSAMLENAGAQVACLVGLDGGVFVEARASVHDPVLVERCPLAQATGIAKDVVHYVTRTGEDVVLEHAAEDRAFGGDRHVAMARVRSLMCIAIRHAGEVRGALYVENNDVVGAFTPRNIELLRIIAGQAATSMENARMYRSLEQKVMARTSELSSRNREMVALLDNVPQGIFTFGPDMRVDERHSAALASVLGTTDIVGRDVMQLLFSSSDASPEARALHDAILRCSFGADQFMAELNWGSLLRRSNVVGQGGGQERRLEIDWVSLLDDEGCVTRILASVKDVTELRALEEELAATSWQANTIDQVLEVSVEGFHRYCGDALERLATCERRVGAETSTLADVEEVFRALHTLKGNGRVLGLFQLAGAVHQAEEPFAAARAGDDSLIASKPLRAALEVLRLELERTQELVRQKLGGLRTLSDSQAEAEGMAVREALSRWEQGASGPAECLERIARAVRGQPSCTVESVVADARRVLVAVAPELDKPVPSVVVQGDAPLSPSAAAALGDALGHVFRNALDHGIEKPEERHAASKPEAGRIEIEVRDAGDGLRMCVRDDGRGLDLTALRRRAPEGTSDARLAESIFETGVSTAAQVTQVSGRGVGMGAVRGSLEALGGSVDVVLTGNERSGRHAFEIVITIPQRAAQPAGGASRDAGALA